MHVRFRGVNEAFRGLVQTLDEADGGEGGCEVVRVGSRNGPVMRVVGPVTVSYDRPRERVLLNTARDANPFLMLYESLWMLAGRNDVAPLAYYAERMRDYSDDGRILNGAYGYRWRHPWSGDYARPDQIKTLVDHLRANPNSRRAVLQMWNVEDDLLKIDSSKDVCCNLCVLFSIQEVEVKGTMFCNSHKRAGEYYKMQKVLDMTVFNRSNDMIWGTLGNDFVCFSVLQEYVAAHLGAEVGVYNQVSNDLHVYLEGNSGWKPKKWLKEYESPEISTEQWYTNNSMKMVPLVQDPVTFDLELGIVVQYHSGQGCTAEQERAIEFLEEPFLRDVVDPMFCAFTLHKVRAYSEAIKKIDEVAIDDWREAGRNWLLRRQKNWEKKLKVESL